VLTISVPSPQKAVRKTRKREMALKALRWIFHQGLIPLRGGTKRVPEGIVTAALEFTKPSRKNDSLTKKPRVLF
jgi:hypothetical protein